MKKSRPLKLAPLQFAKRMRSIPTPEENRLWFLLRDRRFSNFKFRRQQVIGEYIVDFICISKKLIVEADGSHHDADIDYARQKYLELLGYRILRFQNIQINKQLSMVSDNIWRALQSPNFNPNETTPSPLASPDPLPPGRGERK